MQEIADQTKDLTNSTHIISVIAFCLLWAQFATVRALLLPITKTKQLETRD